MAITSCAHQLQPILPNARQLFLVPTFRMTIAGRFFSMIDHVYERDQPKFAIKPVSSIVKL